MNEPTPTPGIHHVTCTAANPQRNLEFWTEPIGLRLVKRSINQDDPETYHFFFGDAEGTPGTSMTFFASEGLSSGKVGTGQVARTAFRVPEGSLDYWENRFERYHVPYEDRIERYSEEVLRFRDPDGLPVELVEVEIPDDDPTVPWTEFVPEEAAIRGFHSVTLWVADPVPTGEVLETMGFEHVGSKQTAGDVPGDLRLRFATTGPVGKYVDVLSTIESGRQRAGTVHHVAFQTPTDEDQDAMRDAIGAAGLNPSRQIDRHWFRSVYFREFGDILFELATNGPGYDSDEPLAELGERLVLPGSFEDRREEIEDALPDVTVPRSPTARTD